MMPGVLSSGDTRRRGPARELRKGSVTVVVIAYNDAAHLTEAVGSALAQGEVVGEVVVVDDASTDGTGAVADRLAEASPRVRVIHRASNSGGCGTPRNDGADAARGDWIAFLDSDDILPPGALDALLHAARRHDADVAAGLCVRRVLPEGRELPWQPDLFTAESVHDGLAGRPRTLRDTLSVNKLYRRDFLVGMGVRFPEGASHYEDFVFTGRLYAAAPRFAVIPDTVYVWHVRPRAAHLSISLRQDRIGNWLDRLAAHRAAVDALSAAGEHGLVSAARTKFLGYDVPMYLRELHRRTPEYQREWWRSAREYTAAFEPLDIAGGAPADGWRTGVLLGRADPATVDLERLAELSAVPPRLAPPLTGPDAAPVWDHGEPRVRLDGLAEASLTELPLCVGAEVRTGRDLTLRLSLSELYGRVGAGGPEQAEVELRHRVDDTVVRDRAVWHEDGTGRWRAEVSFDAAALRGADGVTVWDAWAAVVFRSGARVETKVRAGGGLGRRVSVGRGGRLLLLSPYATVDRSLAVRVAGARSGVSRLVADRLPVKRR
jgi:glycosyltransferase involved in cell wall biosynthesis